MIAQPRNAAAALAEPAYGQPPHSPPRAKVPAKAQPPIWKQMPSGRMVDLMAPKPADIDIMGDILPALASIARFDGACAPRLGRPWTVLDHSVIGADLLSQSPHNPARGHRLPLLFLLHDAHEAYIGDITTPVAQAIEAQANRAFPGVGGYGAGYAARVGLGDLKFAWDAAIHAALGVAMPDQAEKRILREHDLRLMLTERNQMMVLPDRPWGDIERMQPLTVTGALRPGNSEKLVETFLVRLNAWAPQARARMNATA
jgi:uncharacterized protein